MSDLRGIVLMVASMAAFAIGDATLKVVSASISAAQSILLMALFGTAMFAAFALRAGHPLWSSAYISAPILTRNVVEALTALAFFSAVAAAPLSLVISITQAVPLIVTLGAAILLRERVGPRRWGAIFAGFIGVLIMLRPWTGEFAPGALWAILAAIGLATRDLAARYVPAKTSTLQLALWGMASLIPASVILFPLTAPHGALDGRILGLMAVTSIAAGTGYYLVTAAMRLGDVSLVSPFRYTRLLFALALAVIFLGERPEAITLLGAGIVIASGLFVLLRERAIKRQTAQKGDPT